MEGYVSLILLILGVPFLLAIWLIARAVSAKENITALTRRLAIVESEVLRLKKRTPSSARPESIAAEEPAAQWRFSDVKPLHFQPKPE